MQLTETHSEALHTHWSLVIWVIPASLSHALNNTDVIMVQSQVEYTMQS